MPYGPTFAELVCRGMTPAKWPGNASISRGSPPPKLISLRRMTRRWRTLVLVAEDQPPLFQIIRRYFDRDAIPGEGLDPILFHPARRVSDKVMTVVELNAITAVRQYFSYETLKLQQLFLGHNYVPCD
jgi:hypothetical protein